VDLSKAEEFYTALGLSLIVRDSDYLRFECPDGGSTFSIELVDSVPPGEQVTIYFESDDLNGLCDRLIDEGVLVENRRNPPWRIQDGPSRP
jgi:catechol 2,3-dioxygenase-like lactoylglutathione lyase family enzyme